VGKLAVCAYAQNLGALLLELAIGPTEGGGLGGSAASEIKDMEYQDYTFFALVLA